MPCAQMDATLTSAPLLSREAQEQNNTGDTGLMGLYFLYMAFLSRGLQVAAMASANPSVPWPVPPWSWVRRPGCYLLPALIESHDVLKSVNIQLLRAVKGEI